MSARRYEKSPGQLAYEEDVRRRPAYHDGAPRHAWAQLDAIARWSWDRNPTQRFPPLEARA